MENFKGTKGKWLVTEFNYDEIKSESGFFIADCWDMGTETFPNPDEAKANALLISKAPEMLEMLEEVSTMIKNKDGFRSTYEEIKQLIREATEV
jgi:hypothetical protein